MTFKDIPQTDVAGFITQLAIDSKVTVIKTFTDEWANKVTELAGDVIKESVTEDLLIALSVAGRITDEDFIKLLFNYVNEPSNV